MMKMKRAVKNLEDASTKELKEVLKNREALLKHIKEFEKIKDDLVMATLKEIFLIDEEITGRDAHGRKSAAKSRRGATKRNK